MRRETHWLRDRHSRIKTVINPQASHKHLSIISSSNTYRIVLHNTNTESIEILTKFQRYWQYKMKKKIDFLVEPKARAKKDKIPRKLR